MDHSECGGLCTPCSDVSFGSSMPRDQSHGLNRLPNQGSGEKPSGDSLSDRILRLRDVLGCDAIGIRLVDDDGHLIYRAHHGFPTGFCDYISGVCVPDEQCICVKVLHAKLVSANACHTDRGSLVANSPSDMRDAVPGTPDRIPHLTGLDACYQSVVLTPLRCMDHNLGIIHSASAQSSHFTPERVIVLEETADEIARDLFYDSLWRPVHGIRDFGHPVRAQAICPICGRRREEDHTWESRHSASSDLPWTVLGAPRVVCPACLKFCNFE